MSKKAPSYSHLRAPGRHLRPRNFRRVPYFSRPVQAGCDQLQSLPGFPSHGWGKDVVAQGVKSEGGIDPVINEEVEGMPKHGLMSRIRIPVR